MKRGERGSESVAASHETDDAADVRGSSGLRWAGERLVYHAAYTN